MKRILIFFILLFSSKMILAQQLPVDLLKLPLGFNIQIFATNVPNARQMTLGAKGTIFVGSFSGNVYAIVKDKNTPNVNHVILIATGLNMPNGVAFQNGALYVAEKDRILRYDNIEDHLNQPPIPIIVKKLPNEKIHGWHYIGIGPDKKLYVSIGIPCNICLPSNPIFGTIARMNLDGSQFEIVVKGLRNSVGFDWDPVTKALWLTNNGADYMGDDVPSDELYYAPQTGMNFGFPYYHGTIPDETFGKNHPLAQFNLPAKELPAHVAPLGMKFYTGFAFPKEFQHQIFIALHGSWNRSSKVGYQVIVATVKNNQVIDVKTFINGWLQEQNQWGRPVDLLVLPDGSLLISDDYAGVIYRVTYVGK